MVKGLIKGMIMKGGKVLCSMFLLAILGVDPAQTLGITGGSYVCSYN